MKLTKIERMMFINQFRILDKLYPEEGYDNDAKALEEGYEREYEDIINSHVYEEGVSKEECQEVIDILNMYRSIYGSYKNLKDKSGIDKEYVSFRGFDGNEEGRHYSYACYYLEDLGRYHESTHNEPNSHCRMLPTYREMLKLWKSIDRFELTKEEILKLINI